jgi:Holliday junction resolvase
VRGRRTDANQSAIIATLKAVGASVVDLSAVGRGVPDLLVGFRGQTYLLEVKNKAGRNRITADQEVFYAWWRGVPPIIVYNEHDALTAIDAVREP